jgi:tRNA (cmo5U34)-methyltransferase
MSTSDNARAHASTEYDAQVETSIPYHTAFHREVLRFVKVLAPRPERWLDTGCGTGSLVANALDVFPSTRFYLADPSTGMLEEAKEKLGSRVSYLGAAGTGALTVDAELRFDVVTAIQCHHYLDPPGRRLAVAACHRLLRDGGLFVAFENVRPASDEAVDIGKRYWRAYQVEMGKTPEAARAHVERFDHEFFPITVEEHLKLLREVGFEKVGLLWYSYVQAGVYGIK